LHNPAATGRRLYAGFTGLAALAGLGVAGRHSWMQHLPPEDVPACGPGLDYWMQTFPLQDVIQKVLHGSGECAKVDWVWLGLSLPEWTLVMFSGIVLVCGWQLLRKS
jgi:disulfide bond formation protein DsbB